MKPDTRQIIKSLKAGAWEGKKIMELAADRLEELQRDFERAYKLRKEAEIERDSLRDSMALDMLELTQQRDEAYYERDYWKNDANAATGQRDEARAEVERLKENLIMLATTQGITVKR